MKIGILGAGAIAREMAKTLKFMEGVCTYAIAARELKRAEAFKEAFGFEKAYGSYEEMLQDPEVELIYVATPHSHHYEHAKMCIEHGKHVLCEKAFTVNEKEAQALFERAKEKDVLLTEAIWTRYMPARNLINEIIESGLIGTVSTVTANLSYPIWQKERIKEPSLAGGALLDLGVYTINFALMVLGTDIEKIDSSVLLSDKGVDMQHSITMYFKGNKMASLSSSTMVATNRQGIIAGDKGYIVVQNINNPERIEVFNEGHELIKEVEIPEQITGYEYEVYDTIEAIKKGERECKAMPHVETLRVMGIMDGLRKQWGMVYPMERA